MSEFIRYILVQVAAYALDMGSFLFVLWGIGDYPLWGNLLGKVLAGCFAFVAHNFFTFRQPQNVNKPQSALRYMLLLLLNLPISSALLSLVMPLVSPEPLAKFVADAIGLVITFFLSKRFVFNDKTVAPKEPRSP